MEKLKLMVKEMYFSEYYESLSKNIVTIEQPNKQERMIYIAYNQKSKMDMTSQIVERKMLEAALGGTEIEAIN